MLSMRLIAATKLLVFFAFSLLCFVVLAAFFPVPVDQVQYQATMADIEDLRATQGYVLSDDSEKSAFPQEGGSDKPQFDDVIKSIAWRPWVAIISTFLVMCIWRRVDVLSMVVAGIFSAALLAIGLKVASVLSLAGFGVYAVIYSIALRRGAGTHK